MVLIIDEDKAKRAADLMLKLDSLSIPSVLTTLDGIKDYPEFLVAVAFVDSEQYLNLVSVRLGKCHLVAINRSGGRIYNNDAVFCEDEDNVTDFVLNFIRDKLSVVPGNLTAGDLLVTYDSVRYGLTYLKLTVTEKRILSLFVLMKNRWIQEKTIRRACFGDSSKRGSDKVRVHICNLNKKGRAYTGKPLILCKRGVGYRLNHNV